MTALLRLFVCAFVCIAFFTTTINAQTWTTVTTDASGDGANSGLLDGTAYSYDYDDQSDSVWFKVDLANLNGSNAMAVGVNIMVNIPGGGSTFNFWGSSNTAAYHKLVTVWVTGNPPSSYSGTIGVANAAGVNATNYTNLSSNNIDINVDVSAGEIILGMKRTDLVTDSEMGGNTVTMNTAAAVGSNQFWNDDIFQQGSSMTITLAGPMPLNPPTLTAPANNATDIPTTIQLKWNTVNGATAYDYEVSTNSNFSSTEASGTSSNGSTSISGLAQITTYFWHVRSTDGSSTSDWSPTFRFTTTDAPIGIDELNTMLFNVYPNPTNHQFTIELDSPVNENSILTLVNALGQEVKTIPIQSGTERTVIDINDLERGVYFLKGNLEGRTITQPVIKR